MIGTITDKVLIIRVSYMKQHDGILEDCVQEFVSYKWFWRSVVTGLVALVGICSGAVSWAMSTTSTMSGLIEKVSNQQHTIEVLVSENKVLSDRILTQLNDIAKRIP